MMMMMMMVIVTLMMMRMIVICNENENSNLSQSHHRVSSLKASVRLWLPEMSSVWVVACVYGLCMC